MGSLGKKRCCCCCHDYIGNGGDDNQHDSKLYEDEHNYQHSALGRGSAIDQFKGHKNRN